jgi:hypothetical protein
VDPSLNGKSVIITAATGAAKAWPGKLTNEAMNDVACPTATACYGVGSNSTGAIVDQPDLTG